jgi:hypothetical protein
MQRCRARFLRTGHNEIEPLDFMLRPEHREIYMGNVAGEAVSFPYRIVLNVDGQLRSRARARGSCRSCESNLTSGHDEPILRVLTVVAFRGCDCLQHVNHGR